MNKSRFSTRNTMRSNITQSSERQRTFTSENHRHKKISGKLKPGLLLPSDSLFSSSSTSITAIDSSSVRGPSSIYNPILPINFLLSDIIQSSANMIYSNVKRQSSGYFFEKSIEIEKNLIYTFENTLNQTKNMPLVFVGSEYFFRKPIRSERLVFPLSNSDDIEPLIDLFLSRPEFAKEIPILNDLSRFRTLPQSINGSIFFDSSLTQACRHSCSEWRTKEYRNHFNINDLLHMSQRENNIIQTNALNDRRFDALKNELSPIFASASFNKEHQQTHLSLGLPERFTRSISPMSRRSIPKNLRAKTYPTHVY